MSRENIKFMEFVDPEIFKSKFVQLVLHIKFKEKVYNWKVNWEYQSVCLLTKTQWFHFEH